MEPDSVENQNEPTLEESITSVMGDLPPPIRTYLQKGQYTPVVKQLMQKYGLHMDQATVLERETILMLMGIEDPSEFEAALSQEAAIPQDMVRSIMADINQQIFIPLRAQLGPPTASAPTPTPTRPAIPVPTYAPSAPQVTTPVSTPLTASMVPKIAVPQTSGPRLAITIPAPAQPVPGLQMSVQSRPVPVPPPNLPGAMPPLPTPPPAPVAQVQPSPQSMPAPVSSAPKAAPRTPTPVPPPRVPGTPDPYREPVE